MKKLQAFAAVCCLMLASCGTPGTTGTNTNATSPLGSILGAVIGNAGTIENVITSVIGFDKLTASQLTGTWSYRQPGVAFTSENLLAKAGGEVAASQLKEKLQPYYQQAGITQASTQITFQQDGTYSAVIAGQPLSGKWTFNESTGALTMKGLIITLNGYAKRTSGGISILFESKKVLTLLQTASAISGNANIQQIGEISKNYDGVRIGFDLTK